MTASSQSKVLTGPAKAPNQASAAPAVPGSAPVVAKTTKASAPADLLTPHSLDWARAHITRFGDTDVFPPPFEFEAIWSDWQVVRRALEQQDLGSVPHRGARILLVPKPRGGFRVATQLDPLDAVLYAAMGFEAAPKVEASRVDAGRRVACSYRLDPKPTGELFVANGDGWADFQEQSRKNASHRSCTHVAIADISDFYNQIYHHRLQSALEHATITEPRPSNVEAFLGRYTAKQSRGIPVGPKTSIIFSEACLIDVDQRLFNAGFTHTRYVDDFRIFCKSEREAVAALHDLTRYLFTAHKLSLQAHKTLIMLKDEFVTKQLLEPEEREKKNKIAETKKLVKAAIDAAGGYGALDLDEDEILEGKEQEIARKALKATFKSCVSRTPLNLGVARYVLRRAASLRTREIATLAIESMAALTPVFHELVQYFDRAWSKKLGEDLSSALPLFLSDGSQGWLPYVRDWALWLIVRREVVEPKVACSIADSSDKHLQARYRALLALKHHEVDWVREQKETWMNAGPWERRAVLWAGAVLPRDERKSWLEPVTRSDDVVDAAIAKFVRAQ